MTIFIAEIVTKLCRTYSPRLTFYAFDWFKWTHDAIENFLGRKFQGNSACLAKNKHDRWILCRWIVFIGRISCYSS